MPHEVASALRLGEEPAFSERDGECYYLDFRDGAKALVFGPLPPMALPDFTSRLILWICISVCFALLFWVLLKRTSRDLLSLERSARAIAEGHLEARIPCQETGAHRFVTAFNEMAESLQQVITSKQNLLRAVSHELRTPISRVIVAVHLLRSHAAAPAHDAYWDGIERDIHELEALVGEILTHSRLSSPGQQAHPAAIELSSALTSIVEDVTPRREVAVYVRFESAPKEGDAVLFADPALFKRAMRNLLDNGLQHAMSEVVVEATREEDGWFIYVTDDGPGIPIADRKRVFEPFVRLDPGSYKGHGLGLALVQEIVRHHGGVVFIQEVAGKGCRVVTRWPDR